MPGEIVFKLRAENSASLSKFNGRFMHAAFFKLVHVVDADLERFIHERLNIKPFTVSFLMPIGFGNSLRSTLQISRHDSFVWRVTALNEEIFRAAASCGSLHFAEE